MSNKFKIQIPASSSNLGPGFDCFGLALNIFNEYKVEITNTNDYFDIESNLSDDKFCINNKDNLFYKSYLHLFTKNSVEKIPGIKVKLNAQIPCSGGFGSSGTAVLAGLMAANKILDNKLTDLEIVKEASILEKHPDNVCASMLGGFCLSKFENNELTYKKIDWKLNLDILMLYPTNFRVSTSEARSVLKKEHSLENCISNLSNSAFFTAAVLTKDLQLLTKSMNDKIHEAERLKLIPGALEIITMAKENQAIGATISGSGASLIVFVNSKSNKLSIQNKAEEIWQSHKIESNNIVCKVSNSGALIY